MFKKLRSLLIWIEMVCWTVKKIKYLSTYDTAKSGHLQQKIKK